jgi:deoxycytidine triphosphate deaminase
MAGVGEPVPTSVLSDGTIRRLVHSGRIVIAPYDPGLVQPASYDLRLGDSFRVFHNHRAEAIDLRAGPPAGLTEEVVVGTEEGFVIHPGEFCLGRTTEWVELPDDVVARIEGKALALDTEVPTPSGWTTMGEIQPGDEVFGPDGRAIRVIEATGVISHRPCREVVFSDGTTVVADIHHRWEVLSETRRQVLTTAQIERTLERSAYAVAPAPPRLTEAALAGSGGCGEKRIHTVHFSPHPTRRTRVGRFARGRAIVAVRPAESVPVRCIQVASARGVYLVTRALIPTHNSSLGRLGLIVHATAGFIDPGWKGTLTLELNNLTRVPIKLYPGVPIAQLSFMGLDRPAERPYGSPDLGSHYQGQVAATESRYMR